MVRRPERGGVEDDCRAVRRRVDPFLRRRVHDRLVRILDSVTVLVEERGDRVGPRLGARVGERGHSGQVGHLGARGRVHARDGEDDVPAVFRERAGQHGRGDRVRGADRVLRRLRRQRQHRLDLLGSRLAVPAREDEAEPVEEHGGVEDGVALVLDVQDEGVRASADDRSGGFQQARRPVVRRPRVRIRIGRIEAEVGVDVDRVAVRVERDVRAVQQGNEGVVEALVDEVRKLLRVEAEAEEEAVGLDRSVQDEREVDGILAGGRVQAVQLEADVVVRPLSAEGLTVVRVRIVGALDQTGREDAEARSLLREHEPQRAGVCAGTPGVGGSEARRDEHPGVDVHRRGDVVRSSRSGTERGRRQDQQERGAT